MGERSRDRYLHGASVAEQERLALMNGILNRRCLAELELRSGERVLEMGAGTGLFAVELARAVGLGGEVVAIERDPDQLARARAVIESAGAAVELRAGEVADPPLADDEWGGFELVHARFLLEHLADPLPAVRAMVRAARPGGRIALIDDDHSLMRFWPDPGGMTELWSDYARQFERLGNDPNIGRRLVSLLSEAGARPLRATQINYGGCAGEQAFAALVRNLAEVVAGARGAVVASTRWTAAEFDAALDQFRRWGERPDAVIWYALPMAVGLRP